MSKHFSTAARNVLSAITKIDQVASAGSTSLACPHWALSMVLYYANIAWTTCVPFVM